MSRFRGASALMFFVALVTVAASAASDLDVLHPSAVKATPGHAVALCPSPAALDTFTSRARGLASQEASLYGRRGLATDLGNADRAWWPHVRALWRSPRTSRLSTVVLGSEAAARSGFALFLRPACGTTTVNRSLMVTVGPSQSGPGPHCNACNEHLFYVNRHGKPLLWLIY